MTVDILGTQYKIIKKHYDEDKCFKQKSIIGYCDDLSKQIIFADARTFPNWEEETEETIQACNKETLRHEIIHAFFHESGLKDSSNKWDGAWSKNEEMIDWFAIQGLKIYNAWKQADCV